MISYFRYIHHYVFQMISFDVIRVESPLNLVINGKKASADFQAGIELSTFAKSDWRYLCTILARILRWYQGKRINGNHAKLYWPEPTRPKDSKNLTLSCIDKYILAFYKRCLVALFLQYIHYTALYIDPSPKFTS